MRKFDNERINHSTSRTFSSILKESANRRRFLQAGLTTTAAGLLSSKVGNKVLAQANELVGFEPVSRSEAATDWVAVSQDYEFDIVLPWGDPIEPAGPSFEHPVSSANQERQIGAGHDGMWFFQDEDADTGVLCLNHEFGSNDVVIGKSTPTSLEEVKASQHAHGVSVLDIEKVEGIWQVSNRGRSRRIHVNTPVEFSGPAKDSKLLDIANRPAQGTLNNCGSGPTPWNTYLTCEENVNGYFGSASGFTRSSELERYGFNAFGFLYGWHLYDERFDLAGEFAKTEPNRFGWVVEIDPFDSNVTPVKRTALGRFKHEAACTVVGKDNRVVVYMGDDQVFEYIYKFVGNEDYEVVIGRGESPLDHGRLYVARFDEDNTGEWLELTVEDPRLKMTLGSQDRVLTYARIAGELVGATAMDRPEWFSISADGQVYCSLTNNSNRTEAHVHAANPQAPNPDGHIIRFMDSGDHVGTTFTWEIFKLASSTHGTEESFSDPDCVYADPDGRLFILTDGGQQEGMNNQLLVANTHTGEVKRLLSGVPGCEITGITHTADRREYFVNVQHPGNGDFTMSDFPRIDSGYKVPRDATLVIRRKDGGVVGS